MFLSSANKALTWEVLTLSFQTCFGLDVAMVPQDWKRSVFSPIPKKGNDKECSNYCTVSFISHTSKVVLNILQARFQQNMNLKIQMFKLDLEKAEEPEIKLPTSAGSWKKQRVPEKHLFMLY